MTGDQRGQKGATFGVIGEWNPGSTSRFNLRASFPSLSFILSYQNRHNGRPSKSIRRYVLSSTLP